MIMNKKFSTLMALALVSGSVSAQNWADPMGSTVQGAYRTFATKSAPSAQTVNPVIANTTAPGVYTLATGSAWTKNVNAIDRTKWYQLEVDDANTTYPDVLIQERDYETGKIYLRVVNKATAPLNASLWKIEYDKADGVSGGNFRYINKETGLALTFDHSVVPAGNAAITELRAGIADWTWYTIGSTSSSTLDFTKVYSYLHDQSANEVMYLAYAAETDVWENQTVADLRTNQATKGFRLTEATSKYVKAKVVDATVAGPGLGNLSDVLTFKPVVAAPFFMTAGQFNTRMDADMKNNNSSFMFKMNKDLFGADAFLNTFTAETQTVLSGTNPVTDGNTNGNIQQVGIDGTFTAVTTENPNAASNQFVLNFKTSTGYLLADTSRYQNTLAPSISPAVQFAVKTPQITDNIFMAARYYFRATYFPTNDSLVVEPLNAAVQSDKEWSAKTTWKNSQATQSFVRSNFTKANTLVNNEPFNGSKTVSLTIADIPGAAKPALTAAKDNLNEFGVKTTIERPFEYLERSSVKTGLYWINLANHTDRNRRAGQWIVNNMAGEMMYDAQAKNQDYSMMPATMWVVEQLGCDIMGVADSAKYVKISNREYPGVVFEGQLYSKDDVAYRFINRSTNYTTAYDASTGMFVTDFLKVADSLTFTEVKAPHAYTDTHGYKWFTEDQLVDGVENNYNIKLNSFTSNNMYLQSAHNEKSTVVETENPVFYEIAEASWNSTEGALVNQFGNTAAGIGELSRKAYIIKVKDNNLIDNNRLYLASKKGTDGLYYYTTVKTAELNNVDTKLGVFYLKADQVHLDANNAVDDSCYVLIDINVPTAAQVTGLKPMVNYTLDLGNGWRKVAIENGSQMGVLRDNALNDRPNDVADAFYTQHEVRNQYINIASDYTTKLNSNIKIYQQLFSKEYLFEDNKDHNKVQLIQNINKGFHYLGLESKGMDVEKTAAFYVDEVVNDYSLMPRYLFGVRVDSIPDGYICNDPSRIHGYWDNKADAERDGEVHFDAYNGYTAGWFLVNLNDSVNGGDPTHMMDNANLYRYNSYTRLGFVEGIHQVAANGSADTLYVVNPGYTLNDLMTIKDNGSHVTYTKKGFVLDPSKLVAPYVNAIEISGNVNTNHTFSLRKLNDKVGTASESEPFLIESACASVGAFDGAWVKTENGIPVIAQVTTTGDHEQDAADQIVEKIGQSGVFYFGTTTDEATANDDITVSSVSVIGGNGSVQVIGAEGKKVTINNILGQTIAATVITSDNATISVPAGIVVVAIEGEAAVKAIVK